MRLLFCPCCGTSYVKDNMQQASNGRYHCPRISCRGEHPLFEIPLYLHHTISTLFLNGFIVTEWSEEFCPEENEFVFTLTFSTDGSLPTNLPEGWHLGNVPEQLLDDDIFVSDSAQIVSESATITALVNLEKWAEECDW